MEFLIFLFFFLVFLVGYFYIGSRIATRFEERIFETARRNGNDYSYSIYGKTAKHLARRYTVLMILFWGILAPFYAIVGRYLKISDKAEETL